MGRIISFRQWGAHSRQVDNQESTRKGGAWICPLYVKLEFSLIESVDERTLAECFDMNKSIHGIKWQLFGQMPLLVIWDYIMSQWEPSGSACRMIRHCLETMNRTAAFLARVRKINVAAFSILRSRCLNRFSAVPKLISRRIFLWASPSPLQMQIQRRTLWT